MGIVKDILYTFTPSMAIEFVKRYYDINIITPYYHVVTNERLSHIYNLYSYKTEKQFIKDIDYLCQHFVPVSLEDVMDCYIYKRKKVKKGFILTFDDGLREIYDVVAPILAEKKIPAIIFINNDFVDNKNLFYRYKVSLIIHQLKENETYKIKVQNILLRHGLFKTNLIQDLKAINYRNKDVVEEVIEAVGLNTESYLNDTKPYLTGSQIRELKESGFYIGAHSVDHPKYNEITFAEQVYQTSESISFVKQNYDVPYKLFAFPHTDKGVKAKFFHKILDEDKIADLIFGNSGLVKDIDQRIIQRFSLENPDKVISKLIPSEMFYSSFKKLIKKDKIYRG